MRNLEQDRKSLIEIIEWYRDEYHKGLWNNNFHNDLIEQVKNAQTEKELEYLEKVVDGWLDDD